MKIIFSEDCLKFSEKGHPESPERVKNAYEFLRKKYEIVSPVRVSEKDILKAHSKELVEKVKNNNFFDLDCPNYENIYYFASLSAAGAITAAKEGGFSLMRPPGHHAGKNFLGGFCYFNNIAIAIKNVFPDKKVLIVDIDGHHGNGTEDIFKGDENVVYLSLHRSPYYPGTGLNSYNNIVNKPLPGDIGEEIYLKTLKEALNEVSEEPDIVAVSAGFDTLKGDLASLGLETETYRKIGKIVSEIRKPTFAVLEGGYSEYLGKCIDSLIQGLLGQGFP